MSNKDTKDLELWLLKMKKGNSSELERRIGTQDISAIKKVCRQTVLVPRGHSLVSQNKSQNKVLVIDEVPMLLQGTGQF